MSTVWVVGSINEDLRLTVAAHVRPGETVTAESGSRQLGGKGLNQAVAARRAGAATSMIAAIGDDKAGRAARGLLDAEGVDARLFVAPDTETGSAVVAVDRPGENAIIVVPGANAEIPDHHVRSRLRRLTAGDIVLLQLELPLTAVLEAATAARRAGALVVLNAAPYRPEARTVLAGIDVLVVNASELEALVPGQPDPAAAAADLASRERLSVLVTLGADGSLLAHDETITHVPARTVRAVDTTAAGDTYLGFLVAALADGSDLRAAMEAASAAAATAVSRAGATASIPTASELRVPASD